jgi:hypothetical protein
MIFDADTLGQVVVTIVHEKEAHLYLTIFGVMTPEFFPQAQMPDGRAQTSRKE